MKNLRMRSYWMVALLMLSTLLFTGCASVSMGSKEQDASAKTFAPPSPGKAGLYIYRNSFMGQALSKAVSMDSILIGKTANKVYFYKEVAPGSRKLTTESEFGDNELIVQMEAGKHYFVRQYIKMGVFLGGSNLELVTEDIGKKEVLECSLAESK